MMSTALRRLWRAALWPVVLVLLHACGGGVGEDGTGAPVATSASVGAITAIDDQTMTVNGVSFQRDQASTIDGLDQARTADSLSLGMWVEVVGTVADDGTAGSARIVTVRPALRGRVAAVDPAGQTLLVLGTTVHVDDSTVVAGVDQAANLAVGALVEVHGALEASPGHLRATRIERLDAMPPSPDPYELRGIVSELDLDARTMTVGAQAVSFDRASVELRAGLKNGQVVRVAAPAGPADVGPAAAAAATPTPGPLRWTVRRVVADQSRPDNLAFYLAEGIVADAQADFRFLLEDLPVDASAAEGRSLLTGNGQRVAAVGALRNGVLKAKAVTPVTAGTTQIFQITGAVSDFVSIADFQVRGVHIDASAARCVNCTAADVADGRVFRVRGTFKGRMLKATAIEWRP